MSTVDVTDSDIVKGRNVCGHRVVPTDTEKELTRREGANMFRQDRTGRQAGRIEQAGW